MDLITIGTVGGSIIAIVKAAKEAFGEKVNGLITIVLAAALGAVAGLLALEGLSLQDGIMVGLGASGLITTIDRARGN